MSVSENTLKNVTVDEKDYFIKVLALLDLYLTMGKIQESFEVLENTKPKFIDEGLLDTMVNMAFESTCRK